MKLTITSLHVDAGSGPGSRGGHVIGKTSSGKSIYASAKHPAHKDFTAKDHDNASVLHGMKASSAKNQKDKTHHENQAYSHQQTASRIRQSFASKKERPAEHFYTKSALKNWSGPPPPHAVREGWTDRKSGKAILPGSSEHIAELKKHGM